MSLLPIAVDGEQTTLAALPALRWIKSKVGPRPRVCIGIGSLRVWDYSVATGSPYVDTPKFCFDEVCGAI